MDKILRLNIDSFITGNATSFDCFYRISEFCHLVDSPIHIFGDRIFPLWSVDLTYPNVEYIQNLKVYVRSSISRYLPNLKKVGNFYSDGQPVDMGTISEINTFGSIRNFNNELSVRPLGSDRYLFSNKSANYSRIIVLNNVY